MESLETVKKNSIKNLVIKCTLVIFIVFQGLSGFLDKSLCLYGDDDIDRDIKKLQEAHDSKMRSRKWNQRESDNHKSSETNTAGSSSPSQRSILNKVETKHVLDERKKINNYSERIINRKKLELDKLNAFVGRGHFQNIRQEGTIATRAHKLDAFSASANKIHVQNIQIMVQNIQIMELKKKIRMDQTCLRRLIGRNEKRIEDIEGWLELSDEAQNELEGLLKEEVINCGLNILKKTIKATGSLGTGQRNMLVKYLRENGVNWQPLNKTLNKLAHIKGKPSKAKSVNEALDIFKKVKDIFDMSKNKNKKLKNLSTILEWFLKTPNLILFADGAKAFTAITYSLTTSYLSNKNINILIKLSDQQLEEVRLISERLIKNVKELRQLKETKKKGIVLLD